MFVDAVKESSEQKQRSGSSLSAATTAAATQLHPTGFWQRSGTRHNGGSESVALYLHLNIFIDHRRSRPESRDGDGDGSESPRDGGGGEDQRRRLVPAAGRGISDTRSEVFARRNARRCRYIRRI